jgi:hypothetical protein
MFLVVEMVDKSVVLKVHTMVYSKDNYLVGLTVVYLVFLLENLKADDWEHVMADDSVVLMEQALEN